LNETRNSLFSRRNKNSCSSWTICATKLGCCCKIEMSWENGVFKPWSPPNSIEKELYNNNSPALPGDFTPFYITVAVCTIFLAFVLILNICFCRSERFKSYWLDPNTGNRWILPLWVSSPKNQPPLLI